MAKTRLNSVFVLFDLQTCYLAFFNRESRANSLGNQTIQTVKKFMVSLLHNRRVVLGTRIFF
jgi:hypothetical protein